MRVSVLTVVALGLAGTIALAWAGAGTSEDDRPERAGGEVMEKTTERGWRALTPEEERIIVHKGTERPYSGKFYRHEEDGTYVCRRCGARLYESGDKFDARCGWPSFDDTVPGAVRELPDADGRRTEIVCASCGGHLGHVFRGEGFTEKNTRHCVNSVSLDFSPAGSEGGETAAIPGRTAEAFFAGGCFWGVEYHFERVDGVLSAESGYMGGHTASPSYEQVCSGRTGHAEAVRVVYDPERVDYEALARLFFEIHDPTQRNRQGPDIGTQYRSAVYVKSEAEREVVAGLMAELRRRGFAAVTEVESAGRFWPAEDYHQDYYAKTQKTPQHCGILYPRFGEPSEGLRRIQDAGAEAGGAGSGQ